VSRRRTWNTLAAATLGLVSLLAGGCGEDHTGGTSNRYLFEHNAQFNGGQTVRWPNLPIRVFLNSGVASAGEVTVWTAASGGAVTFIFVGSAGEANVAFRYRGGADICGLTTLEYTDAGEITSADVQVSRSIYRGSQCVKTITHETAHAIGFLDHTSDGGLMDPDGGDGSITPPVAQMFRDLYTLPTGTRISAQVKRLAERRNGRNVMTFVHPVRRR
jgi:hypothetical protein